MTCSTFFSALPSAEYAPPDRNTLTDQPADTFEFALVLAGASSAGVYIAGVLDFLIEALDTWQAARETAALGDIPDHKVLLRVISGASAGGMTGAILSTVVDRAIPTARASNQGNNTNNPFFDTWVNDIDILKLLETKDLKENRDLMSLLDSDVLDEIVEKMFDLAHSIPQNKPRDYIANPLRLLLTTGNLRGIPYWTAFKGGEEDEPPQGHGLSKHRDHVRFALHHRGPVHNFYNPQPTNEVTLRSDDILGDNWDLLRTAALASGAFPFVLRARTIVRKPEAYQYTAVYRDFEAQTPQYRPVSPHFASDLESYSYAAVDGGVMDNEPLELARRILAGAQGRNPREGKKAKRAVVMIDPFPSAPPQGPERADTLLKQACALVTAWINDARFNAEDLVLASAPDNYSRFLIAPSRGDGITSSNGFHMASESLGSFGGFLCRDYRLHDYRLGRRNCQRFLSRHFALPRDNPLFASWRDNAALVEAYAISDRPDHLPIIPLIKGTAVEATIDPLPVWPVDAFDDHKIKAPLGNRFDAVYKSVVSHSSNLPWLVHYALDNRLTRRYLRKRVLKEMRKQINRDLTYKGLLSTD